jgi:acetyl-CoA carboxylase, biotin carboxylase subunit
LDEQMERAISEALNAFGDGSVFIEKYVSSPRHIEIQVLADAHGNVIHLFERECSVQRRHQKVIEEAPSVILTPEIRAAMGKSACDVARSCDYLGAGTCEFIFDENNNFYFLEMNTRLQVEHPVTELITGVDLVRQQILIAMGQPLSLKQEDLKINGHALQLRVYAEDPSNNFLPSIGNLFSYRTPKGVGIRVDDGYEEGMDIPIYYDPMIAKLITYGQDRNEAIARMLRAIEEYEIDGPATTLSFGRFAFSHEAFISGNFDTHFVKKHFSPEKLEQGNEADAKIAAMLISHILENRHKKPSVVVKSSTGNIIRSKWKDRAK